MARNPLDIIEYAESKGKNVPNYKYGPGFTAQGYYQITNPTWRDFVKAAGVDISQYPTAMSAPKEVQRAVAEQIFRKRGFQPWKAVEHLRGQEKNYSVGGGETPVATTPATGSQPATVTTQAPNGALRTYVVSGKDPSIVDRLQPGFQTSLQKMIESAPPEIRPHLKIGSAYRDPEHQARLYQDALRKYGSEAAARKWVAPPGRSKHQHGQAADLHYTSPAARTWAQANAAQYGMHFPMKHEPWHIEPVGSRGGAPVVASAGTANVKMPAQAADVTQGTLAAAPAPVLQQLTPPEPPQLTPPPAPPPVPDAPPPPMLAPPVDYAALMLPRIRRGLLSDGDYDMGLLGVA